MKEDNSSRVFRGGGWNYDAPDARVAFCDWSVPFFGFDDRGFRLSRVVNPIEQLSEVLHEQR